MAMITVMFKGMCCFADGRATDVFAKRVILPRDREFDLHGDEPHVPYVEIEADDLLSADVVEPSKSYKRGDGVLERTYYRFDLDGERVSIRNAAQGTGLVVVPTFDERVPKMTMVCPDCPPNPRPECFLPAPPPELVAAYFDIRSGFLNAGPVEAAETVFDEGTQWAPRRLAQWAQLDLSVHGERAEILIEKFDGSGSRTIPLKPFAAAITIGNGREEDIEERATSTNRREHFDMYYDLAAELPTKRPRPMVPKSALRACAPTQWP
jgi:hypothetical protein